jgi:cholesterol transport system auxiliary component
MSAPRLRVIRHVLPIVCALALSGCGDILPKQEPMEILTSQVHVVPDPSWPQATWQLAVSRPVANDMLDSSRMAVVPTPGRIEVYKGVSWDDTVPEIVQTAAVQAFEDSGKIVAVGRQSNGLRTDLALHLDLRDYEAVYHEAGKPPEVAIVLNAKLVDFAGSRAIASKTFRQSVTASSTDVHAVAQAFDEALTAVTHDLVGWTLVAGEQAHINEPKAPEKP